MNKWIYFLVGILLIIWAIGFFILDFGVFIHILFACYCWIFISFRGNELISARWSGRSIYDLRVHIHHLHLWMIKKESLTKSV